MGSRDPCGIGRGARPGRGKIVEDFGGGRRIIRGTVLTGSDERRRNMNMKLLLLVAGLVGAGALAQEIGYIETFSLEIGRAHV